MEIILDIIAIVLLFALGAVAGSVINVLTYRIEHKKPLMKGDIICDDCGTTLKAREIIPIISFIALKGECPYCKAKIPAREIVGEIICGLMFVVLFYRFGYTGTILSSLILIDALSITVNMTWLKILSLVGIYLIYMILYALSLMCIEVKKIMTVTAILPVLMMAVLFCGYMIIKMII